MKLIIASILSLFISFSALAHAAEPVRLSLEGDVTDASVATLRKQIKDANATTATSIILEINSPGGDVDAGLLLSKDIERSKLPVVCIVDGAAESMATFILESCKIRVMTSRSYLMIHEPAIIHSGFGGQQVRWQNVADQLRFVNRMFAEHYSKRMTLTPKEFLDKVYGGRSWYLSTEEAVKTHAVDFVVDSYDDLFVRIK